VISVPVSIGNAVLWYANVAALNRSQPSSIFRETNERAYPRRLYQETKAMSSKALP
jgi:hypothetical protein